METTAKMLGDEQLLDRCREGDSVARETLAHACLQRVRKTVTLTVGAVEDRDDISQTALMRVFQGLHGFRKESAFTTWVDRVTINTTAEYFRRKPLLMLFKMDTAKVEQAPAPTETDPGREAENRIWLEHLESALLSIKPKKRMAVVLSAAYGYTAKEIANLMDCSLDTAKKRLQHGKKELLACARKRNQLRHLVGEGV